MKDSVLQYTQSLCESLEIDYRLYTTKSHRRSVYLEQNAEYHDQCLQQIAAGTYDFGYQFLIEEGRKYHKVIMVANGQKSVHCFVDKNTGEVYKSASWKSPAKGVRFNLLDNISREKCYQNADWSGGYLYAV
jgi:hypothetical protein